MIAAGYAVDDLSAESSIVGHRIKVIYGKAEQISRPFLQLKLSPHYQCDSY